MRRTDSGRKRPSTLALQDTIFQDAARVIEAEFARPISVEEVAHRVATSPRQLQRAFAEVGGLTFRSYLRRVRMFWAAQLLTATDIPVSEVARRVGYREPSQFTKAFKRTYGATPSELREAGGGAGRAAGAGRGRFLNANSRGRAHPLPAQG